MQFEYSPFQSSETYTLLGAPVLVDTPAQHANVINLDTDDDGDDWSDINAFATELTPANGFRTITLDYQQQEQAPKLLYSWQVERHALDRENWDSHNEEYHARKQYQGGDDKGYVPAGVLNDEFHSVTITLPSDRLEGEWKQPALDELVDRYDMTAQQNRERLAAMQQAGSDVPVTCQWPAAPELEIRVPIEEGEELPGELDELEDFVFTPPNFPDTAPVDDIDEIDF